MEEETQPEILKALRLRPGEAARVWLPLDPDDEAPLPSHDGTASASSRRYTFFVVQLA